MNARHGYSDEEVCGIIMQTMKQYGLDYEVQDTEFSTAIFIRKRSCYGHFMLNSWYKDQLRKTKKEMKNLQEELNREKERNTLEKDITKCNEEVIIKLKEVVDIIQCENGELLHELQYTRETLKTDGTRNKKRSKTVENTNEESNRHTRKKPSDKPYDTESPKDEGQLTP